MQLATPDGVARETSWMLDWGDKPPERGRALMQAWGGPKTLYTLEATGRHGVEWRPAYWKELWTYLEAVRPRSALSAASLTAKGRSPSD